MSNITRADIERLLNQHGTSLMLRGQNLQNLDLSHLNLHSTDFSNANLCQANLSRSNLQSVTMCESILDEATISQSSLIGSTFEGASLVNASLHQSNLSEATFSQADMQGVDLHQSDLRGATLHNAKLDGANLKQANLHEADMTGADLRGADIRETNIEQTLLDEAIYDENTQWPGGSAPEDKGLILSEKAPEDRSDMPAASTWHESGESLEDRYPTLRAPEPPPVVHHPDPPVVHHHPDPPVVHHHPEPPVVYHHPEPSNPLPLGATWDGEGVLFALFSEHAHSVELCLFDTPDAPHESQRIAITERTDTIWHTYLPDVKPGQVYGYRVHGPYDIQAGMRFNPNKLLLDPYAKAITREVSWHHTLFGYHTDSHEEDYSFNHNDSAPYTPRCIVIDSTFDWGNDSPPATPIHKSIIYEVHVRGLTMHHTNVPEELRGTYGGMATPAIIRYLQSLGITAVELLPIHQHADEPFLTDRGLTNYWGYNTLCFFAPSMRYSQSQQPGAQVREFQAMVKALHAAGIEVILDVVYNHTAEGNHLGPTLSLRGIDNRAYYRLTPENQRMYVNYTGCGNTLNIVHPRVLQMVIDSLRYWVTEMHVDGFRFDLAATLARGHHGETEGHSVFLEAIRHDPVLANVKLIAEPWDLAPGGYMVGRFPHPWSEWNDQYRNTIRRFWRGDEGFIGDIARRLSGSSDMYMHHGRSPSASINFVTSHDGFTLRDLVSYERKHNEPNGEGNKDGDQHSFSWNCGVEGATADDGILALRGRQMRNCMATLLLSHGVPMLLGGDEIARTQYGNNNAYCQDNGTSWFEWNFDQMGHDMLAFTKRLLALRTKHPVLRRQTFAQGRHHIAWFRPDGHEMNDHDWSNTSARCIGMLLNGQALDEWEDGHHLSDDLVLVLLNAHDHQVSFFIPYTEDWHAWEVVIDTVYAEEPQGATISSGQSYQLQAHSLAVLIHKT